MLKFIALSGTISVTENLYIYETENEMMVVDCGVGFPDLEMRGVDLVVPDFSYVVKNKNKLKGIILSQGHEDHIGALPFLLREVGTQLWAAPLVTAFLNEKFKDYKLSGVKINTFDPDRDSFSVGGFKVHPFRVTHSVPDSCGFAIDTPEGRIFHVPEHKMDQNPVDGMPFDTQRAKLLVKDKVLFLASDCLGSTRPGYTPEERSIEDNLLKIVKQAKGAVYFTAISSNIGRFQQAINVAKATGRKAVYVGRSVQRKCEIAHDLGYLKYERDTVVPLKKASGYSGPKLMYLISGCFCDTRSSLYRLSVDEHQRVQAQEGDTLIFSADPAPPYTKESENVVIDNLIDRGVDVHYYALNEGLYVSGHGSQEDILDLFKITNPKYFSPVGGAIRFMHAYEKLAIEFGARKENVFKLKPGESVIFEKGAARAGVKIPVKEVLVDGLGIGDVGRVVLSDRRDLSKSGIVVAVIRYDSGKKRVIDSPKLISRGFVFNKENTTFLEQAARRLKGRLDKEGKMDKNKLKKITVSFLEKRFLEDIGREPMILPVVID